MKLKNIISVGMAIALFITVAVSGTSIAAQNSDTNNQTVNEDQGAAEMKNKSEVVYATLAVGGTINAVYVVNHFDLEEGGSITDYGSYKSIQNLTESKQIMQDKDTISFQAEAGDFYYQGNMETTDLPWLFEITYDLDGVTMSPQDIAGKSGKLGIHIKTTQNEKINPAFFENYLLQISLTLDADKCSNINAPDATVADAGNSTMLAFTVMPNKNADLTVTADVSDFTMEGIEISAMPFSMSFDLPDTGSMLKDFEKLPEAISELNNGVGKLNNGTSELKKGANELKSGSGEFKTGLTELKVNSSQITDASTQINDALATISSSLSSGSSGTGLGALTELPIALDELSKGLKGISGGLQELKDGYSMSFTALDAAIKGIPDSIITQEQINKQFPDANEDQQRLLEQLYASYMAGQTVKGTYSQTKQAFDAVVPTIETMTVNIDKISGALEVISSNISTSLSGADITAQLEQLTIGLTQLANNYSAFDQGLKEYMSGVGQLSDGYSQFDSGVSKFVSGVGDLDNGVSELHDGTDKLNDEVSKMPDMMQVEIDNLMTEYVGSDFEDISFVSPKNTSTGLVQFVLKCEGIKLPEITKTATATTEDTKKDETVLDRFLALFKKD